VLAITNRRHCLEKMTLSTLSRACDGNAIPFTIPWRDVHISSGINRRSLGIRSVALVCWADDINRRHEQNGVSSMKRFIIIAIAATTVGAPTVAPSFEADYGTGYRSVAAAPARAHSRAMSRHPAQSYAMSRRRAINNGYLNYDNTGGGSPGYNEMLLNC
jgi:hypothetical protein